MPSSSLTFPAPPHPPPLPPHPHYNFETPSKRISSPDDIRRRPQLPQLRRRPLPLRPRPQDLRPRLSPPPNPHIPPLPPPNPDLLDRRDFPSSPPGPLRQPRLPVLAARLCSEAPALLLPFPPSDELRPAADELLPYLLDSFGNALRIDYGTGHETNFATFLYCLARLGVIREEDYTALVTRVFVAYLELMRKLQTTTYCLEPAGSHGVMSLDDYHFLPFIFGSAQLIDHKYMKPK